MAEVKWVKIYVDMFDNRKIKLIKAMPEGKSMLLVWIQLIVLAGQINDNGAIYFTKEIAYTDEMLAECFDEKLEVVRAALSIFRKFEMLDIVDNIIYLNNWEKYQNTESLDKIREQNKLRVAKHRQKQIAQKVENNVKSSDIDCNVTRNVTVTLRNAIDKDIDKELDIDILDKYDKYDKRTRESDESSLTHFTNLLIWKKYISPNDFDLLEYDDFFREMQKTFAFNEVKKMTNYFIKKVTGQDTVPNNKFGYFKTSMTNSMKEFEKKMNQE